MPKEAAGALSHPRLRVSARALGNVLLGIAVGLAGYYGVTGVVARLDQRAMRGEVAGYAAIVAPNPDTLLRPEGPVMDFEGWEQQDRAYWDELAPGGVFGRLVIPAMDLDTLVVKGHERESLKRGPGWIDYTDLPGATGNVGIAGHRTTFAAPFRRLDTLRPGDTIDLYSPFRRYRYEVAETFQVTPDRVDVMDTTATPILTFSACDPPFSARFRLIVRSKLVEVQRVKEDNTR